MRYIVSVSILSVILYACNSGAQTNNISKESPVVPIITTEKVLDDSDDPAFWIDSLNPANSLVIGTDKNTANGGLYVFDLKGKILRDKSVLGLHRMNNVDIAYGLMLNGKRVDIAVATERDDNVIRVFSLPDMDSIDNGGIPVFDNEKERAPMGVALYTRPADHSIFAIVSRKTGPTEGYLAQYLLTDSSGVVVGKLVRNFGKFSGKKEIESIAVDNELGYVYYSDELVGIRKYYADPERGNEELALFGQEGFTEDNEGISIYKLNDSTGYILVSDQSANTFHVYPREGTGSNPHEHKMIAVIPVSTNQSDGSEVTSFSLPGFEGGMFAAMSTDGTFQFYRWADLARKAGLKVKE